MKNFQELSCIFCGGKNISSSAVCTACGQSLAPPPELEAAILGSYQIVRYIARGFYGLTYKASERYSGKPFALKLISQKSYAQFQKDFAEEVRLYGKLVTSPTVAAYITAGEHETTLNGLSVKFYYIVSDWVEGITFRDLLASTFLRPDAGAEMKMDRIGREERGWRWAEAAGSCS